MSNPPNCYSLLLKNDEKLVYCNITDRWDDEKVTSTHVYAAGFVIAFVALVAIFVGLRKIGPTLRGLCCKCGHNAGCFLLTNFVLAAVLRMLWKLIDIGIDMLTYYRLGSGKLIDGGIYRNTDVINSILAFTIIGILATLISMRIIFLKAEDLKEHGDTQTLKLLMVLVAFLLEDSIQMFLEYFWIQKYVTINMPSYLIIKDFIVAFIAFHSLLCSLCVLKSESSERMDYLFFGFGVAISLLEFVRVGAVIRYYQRGVFHRDCLQVTREGRLTQTPFISSCMSKTDYVVLVLTFLPFCSIPFVLMAFKSDLKKVWRRTRNPFTSTETLEDPMV